MDRALDAGLPRRRDHVARPDRIDPVEDAGVREPLLEEAHAVEDGARALHRPPQ
jgi:hypothetical protein